jgi:hypothetical protein
LSGNNSDSNDGKDNRHEGEDDRETTTNGMEMESDNIASKPAPERWILVLAMAVLASGVVLLALRSVIFSLIFITIGISLFAYWLYVGVRLKEQLRRLNDPDHAPSTKFRVKEGEHVCTCPICKHEDSKACMQARCPCCILTRNKQIIGHFNNPLQ